MQLFFKLFNEKTTSLRVDGDATVASVKAALEGLTEVPASELRLKSATHSTLADGARVDDYGLADGSTVEILMRLRGGGRKVAYFYDGA